jgi:predicted nucleotidyltransferase
MCDQPALNEITQEVIRKAKERLGDNVEKVILYGSYARGTNTDESDIDIMILANVTPEEARAIDKELSKSFATLDLKYDVLVSVYVKDSATFYKFLGVEPFFQSVMRDGVTLSA